jgi:hypothetical protein
MAIRRLANGQGPARAHYLVAAAAEIPDRRRPDVDEPAEREDQEQGHAEYEMG